MAGKEVKQDRHFPTFALDSPFRRFFEDPTQYCAYVGRDQTVADLGCGPGYFTLSLAEAVGPKGIVYAVDSDEKAIRAVERKLAKQGWHNVEAHVTSAAHLSFIQDASVDFVLAAGLLCSMAPRDRDDAVAEMKRILKPSGKAFFIAGRGRMSYVSDAEWEAILKGYVVEARNHASFLEDHWALVSNKA